MEKILGCPPRYNGPAVYVLEEPGTKRFYVGSSMKIRGRLTYQRNIGHVGWAQAVVPMPSATVEKLRRVEARCIKTLIEEGATLANAIFAGSKNHTDAMKQAWANKPAHRDSRVLYTIGEVTAPLRYWMDKFKCPCLADTVRLRAKSGWDLTEALTTPTMRSRHGRINTTVVVEMHPPAAI